MKHGWRKKRDRLNESRESRHGVHRKKSGIHLPRANLKQDRTGSVSTLFEGKE